MKMIITGASGPFGSGVTEGLVERGIAPSDLILVSRDPARLSRWQAAGATVRFGDFDNQASLEAALAGGERMLMISTNRVGQREPQHRNAVNAARAAGVRHVVYTSFVGKPDCVSLAVSDHRFTERLLADSGMAWTILRNAQYSEAMRDAGAPIALRTGEWVSASKGGGMALVTRDDCISAAAAVMASEGHEGRVYDITGPELVSYRQLAAMVAELSGRPIAYREIEPEELYAFFDALGIPRSAKDDHVVNGFGWCSDDMVSFEQTIAATDFAVLSDDVEKLTGRKPESIRDFMARHPECLKSQNADGGG